MLTACSRQDLCQVQRARTRREVRVRFGHSTNRKSCSKGNENLSSQPPVRALTNSVSQSVISRSRPALTPPPARSPVPPLPALTFTRKSDVSVSQSVSYFTVPPRAHPSTGSQSGSAKKNQMFHRREVSNGIMYFGDDLPRRVKEGGAHAPSASQRANIVALAPPASSARTEGMVVCGRPSARRRRACSAVTIGRRRLRPDGGPLS